MTDNLFSPSFGNRPAILVGRESLLRSLVQGLKSVPGSRDRAVLVLGQRGYGKTVLLLELAEAARREGFVVASPTVVSSDMLDRILEKLTVEGEPLLSKKKQQVTGGTIGIMGFSAGIQLQEQPESRKSFALRLSELCGEVNDQGKGVLILVDELMANQAELKQLIIAYQEMVGEGRNIALVMAGLPAAVASTLNDHVLTFLNRAKKEVLSPLRTGDIDLYYKEAFARLGVQITPEMRRYAAEKTEGSPYLMQLIGHYITLIALPGCTLTQGEIQEAIQGACEDFKNDICQTSLAAISEKDRFFLESMAEEADEEVEISAIQQRMNVSAAYTQTYKRRLIQSGIIQAAGRGKVKFAIPFLKEYLKEWNSA